VAFCGLARMARRTGHKLTEDDRKPTPETARE
jgi:hypothetical protein